MKKATLVKTDSLENNTFNLVVTGPVDRLAEINPKAVFLNGKAGETLESVVSVTPSEKYAFSILEVQKKNNTPLEVGLIPPEGQAKTWQIKIKCRSKKIQDWYDELILKTDSKFVSDISIRVSAVFIEKDKTK